jgi:hypothetical protein
MTLKERIENNLTLYTLTMLLAGFIAGVATYKFLLDISAVKPLAGGECKADTWQASARQASWIQLNECPAFPMEFKLTSPGNGAVVNIEANYEDWFQTPVVFASTRPLPKNSNIGVIFKPADSSNYTVIFPGFERTGSENVYRRNNKITLPFKLKAGKLELRALVVDDERKLGQQFGSLDQIKSSDSSVFISEPTHVVLN